eukprot:3736049-Prymnesium_polylepis.1
MNSLVTRSSLRPKPRRYSSATCTGEWSSAKGLRGVRVATHSKQRVAVDRHDGVSYVLKIHGVTECRQKNEKCVRKTRPVVTGREYSTLQTVCHAPPVDESPIVGQTLLRCFLLLRTRTRALPFGRGAAVSRRNSRVTRPHVHARVLATVSRRHQIMEPLRC